MTRRRTFNDWLIASAPSFEGWDFSYLTRSGRMQEFPLTWNYANLVMDELEQAASLLDMGTGGGEFLSALPSRPAATFATEGYEPNVAIARRRLEPLGIHVERISEDDAIPYGDEQFELVINRHESYRPEEVKRVLKPGGLFLTQQVGGLNDRELNEWLGAPEYEYAHWNLDYAAKELEPHLAIVSAREEIVKTRFCIICRRFPGKFPISRQSGTGRGWSRFTNGWKPTATLT